MGDYELVRNNIWESTLLYSQVDKGYKNFYVDYEYQLQLQKLKYLTKDISIIKLQLET